MHYQVTVEDQLFNAAMTAEGTALNGEPARWEVEPMGNRFVIRGETRVVTASILDQQGDELTVEVDGQSFKVTIKDELALMLKALGMDAPGKVEVKEIKAPMPGIILNVMVNAGQSVKKGDGLLILEAMKMENVIKSPVDALIASIAVNKGQSVEKNTVLVTFA
jgi:biotin carboxyl carrier protein